MSLSYSDTSDISTNFKNEIKRSLKIPTSNTDHDQDLVDLAVTAITMLERACGRLFLTRTVTWKFDEFPLEDCLEVPLPPFISVTSIAYIDTDGVEQTWDSSKYLVSTSTPGRIEPIESESWPTTKNRVDAVTITFSAGYGATESTIPAGIRQAIKTCVKYWFEEATPEGEIPSGAMSLIDGFKHGRFSQLMRA